MFCSPRPESSPATIASCGSRQWVAAVRQRYLRLKLHTLCFPTCPPFRRPVLCPEALADTGPPILKPGKRGGQTFVNGGNPLLTFFFFFSRNTLRPLWASPSNRRHPECQIGPRQFSDNARGDTRQLNILTLSVYSTAAIDLGKKLQGSVRRRWLSPIERASQRLKVR